MIDEKKLSQMNEGRMANLALGEFGRYLEMEKKSILSKMMTAFRSGEKEHGVFMSLVAAYCALDDLEHKMKKVVMTGNMVAKELLDHEPPPNSA